MPIKKEHYTEEVRRTKSYFQCDVEDCTERSDWEEDMIHLYVNPQLKSLVTKRERERGDLVDADSHLILCDDHFQTFQGVVANVFGVELTGEVPWK